MLTAPTLFAKQVEVLVACPDDAQAGEAVRALTQLLVTTGLEPREVRDQRSRPCWNEARKQLREQMTQAENAFERLEMDTAQRHAQQAIGHFLGAQALLDERDVYLRARMLLAWIALESRQTSSANEHFAEAVAVSPKFTPDPERYPPPVCNAFAAFKKNRRNKTSSLTIQSNPMGANLIVDGEARGTTPARLDDLGPGWHFVELQLPGFAPSFTSLRMPATNTPLLTLGPAWPQPSAHTARLDLAVAANGVTRIAVRRPGGALAESLATDAASGGIAALATPLSQALGRVDDTLDITNGDAVWWQNPWVWAAAAAVVAGGTAAALVVTKDDRATVTVQPPPR